MSVGKICFGEFGGKHSELYYLPAPAKGEVLNP